MTRISEILQNLINQHMRQSYRVTKSDFLLEKPKTTPKTE